MTCDVVPNARLRQPAKRRRRLERRWVWGVCAARAGRSASRCSTAKRGTSVSWTPCGHSRLVLGGNIPARLGVRAGAEQGARDDQEAETCDQPGDGADVEAWCVGSPWLPRRAAGGR